MLEAIRNAVHSLVYPQECRICRMQVVDRNDGVACRQCWERTRIFDGSELLCNKCGAILGDHTANTTVFCHQCDSHVYRRARAIGVYEYALAASIIDLKSIPILPKTLKDLIVGHFPADDFDIVIPVPLSKQRKLERGYNQAEIIARELSRLRGATVDSLSLIRQSHTPIHRAGMDRKARELTVKNAFRVVRPKLIAGKSVLLVDDVFTSGATGSACADVLKENGAISVDIFTLARAAFA